jgi:imidazolonepropionase-like amidohydrolase
MPAAIRTGHYVPNAKADSSPGSQRILAWAVVWLWAIAVSCAVGVRVAACCVSGWEIARRGIPVVSGPQIIGRSKVELRNLTLCSPGILARAGVLLALTTDHNSVPVQFLALQAALAVKEGLDLDTALRSITANPARILGLDERVGTLKPGLDGDVVLWSGDPLDVCSRALCVRLRNPSFIGSCELRFA